MTDDATAAVPGMVKKEVPIGLVVATKLDETVKA